MPLCTSGTNPSASMGIMWKNNLYQGRAIDYTCIYYLNKFTQWEDLLPYLLNRPHTLEQKKTYYDKYVRKFHQQYPGTPLPSKLYVLQFHHPKWVIKTETLQDIQTRFVWSPKKKISPKKVVSLKCPFLEPWTSVVNHPQPADSVSRLHFLSADEA
jgi:sulfur relay (sulfurtransferase) DsrC/TusE family protein